MAESSKIEWTDATWNPIRARHRVSGKVGWFCTHASPGCVNCYSESMNRWRGTGLPFKPGHLKDVELFLDEKLLLAPLRWRKPRMIFPCSMTDLFGEFVPDEWIDRVFAGMALSPQHTFQVLTKRAARMRAWVAAPDRAARVWAAVADLCDGLGWDEIYALAAQGASWGGQKPWPLVNVWLGVSAEDQARADERIPELLSLPAAVRFVSAEPLLGPLEWLPSWDRLDWVIVGGESGAGARPMHPDWARSLRDQCAAAGVPFFFKQWGEWHPVSEVMADRSINVLRKGERPGLYHAWSGGLWSVRVGKARAGRLLDGTEHNDMPKVAG